MSRLRSISVMNLGLMVFFHNLPRVKDEVYLINLDDKKVNQESKSLSQLSRKRRRGIIK